MEKEWAPPSDPVFCLVPSAFDEQISELYDKLGSPPVSINSFWEIYLHLLNSFHTLSIDFSMAFATANNGEEFDLPLLPGLKEFRNGDQAGGVFAGSSVDFREYVDFSD